jgi:hypothetical protein
LIKFICFTSISSWLCTAISVSLSFVICWNISDTVYLRWHSFWLWYFIWPLAPPQLSFTLWCLTDKITWCQSRKQTEGCEWPINLSWSMKHKVMYCNDDSWCNRFDYLINTLSGNSSVNTVQEATIEEACFPCPWWCHVVVGGGHMLWHAFPVMHVHSLAKVTEFVCFRDQSVLSRR